jgi:AcrR family transcriptional regulator
MDYMPIKNASAPVAPLARGLTRRGVATRQRIVEAAAKLTYQRGAGGTSLDEVMAESGTSKSQLYHYFVNKEALLLAVIEIQTERVLRAQSPYLERLDSVAALRRWRDAVVKMGEQQSGVGGCPIGSLASELAEESDAARKLLVKGFHLWETHLLRGFNAMRARGELSADADPRDLATATLSALQGGILLAQTYRTARPIRVALDMALQHIERQASTGSCQSPGERRANRASHKNRRGDESTH